MQSAYDLSGNTDASAGDERQAHVNADYAVTIAIPLLPDISFNYDTSVTVPLAPL